MQFHRRQQSQLDVARARDLPDIPSDRPVRVAGAVVVRQRPGTAKGFVFLNLEDETGLVNVIVRPALFRRHHLTITGEPFLLVEGGLQHEDGVTSIRAERLEAAPAHPEVPPRMTSSDLDPSRSCVPVDTAGSRLPGPGPRAIVGASRPRGELAP